MPPVLKIETFQFKPDDPADPYWCLRITADAKPIFEPRKRYANEYAANRAAERYVKRYKRTGSFDPPVHVNADSVEAIAAAGFSLVHAARIVEARRADGPFKNLTELKARTSVDEPTLDRLGRRFVY